jgi:hypothetical protein
VFFFFFFFNQFCDVVKVVTVQIEGRFSQFWFYFYLFFVNREIYEH